MHCETTVLLLEAGGSDTKPEIQIPVIVLMLSIALFHEFFPGFTSFGEDSFSEVEEYFKEREIFK